jgi:hypothetical protein
MTSNHIFPSHPGVCSLSVASYESQGLRWKYCNPPPHGDAFWSCSSSCGRQSVDQFVWVSGLPLGPLTRFYLALLFSADIYLILLSKASSLTRKRVCSLQCNHSLKSTSRVVDTDSCLLLLMWEVPTRILCSSASDRRRTGCSDIIHVTYISTMDTVKFSFYLLTTFLSSGLYLFR